MVNLPELEKRNFSQKLEIRADSDEVGHIISGYAIVFNQPSEDMGFIETVDPKALDGVDISKVFCLYNHDFANVLARTDTKTLKLNVDSRGLHFICNIPNTTLGNDVFENIRNGNVQGCSFGFTVANDHWDEDDKGNPTRRILQIGELNEISLTCIPAYEETSVEAQRSYEKYKKSRSEQQKRFSLWLELTEKENELDWN